MPSIAPVISPAATPWTAGGSTGSTDVFRAPATAAARRWAPVTGSGEGLSNREKGTPRHGRAHAMHLCASVWPASRPTLYDTGTHTGQLAHARFRHTGQCIQALHMLGERCHREVGTPPNPRLTVRRGPRPRRCLVSWLGCVHRIHWRACPFHVSPPQLFVDFSSFSRRRASLASTGCHSAQMAHMFFPVSQQDAAGTSPALPAAFVLAGDPAAPKTALLLSYAYSGALRGACFPFPQGCQAGRGCCARERM